MPDKLIVNASPLIFLHRGNGWSWLCEFSASEVLVSDAVMREIRAGWDGAEIDDAVERESRLVSVDDVAIPPLVAAWDLGTGETQVLSHCIRCSTAVAVLDDAAARRCAQSLDIPVVGTLGILLAARRKGWIPAAQPVIEQLISEGLYLSPSLVAEALAEIGEALPH